MVPSWCQVDLGEGLRCHLEEARLEDVVVVVVERRARCSDMQCPGRLLWSMCLRPIWTDLSHAVSLLPFPGLRRLAWRQRVDQSMHFSSDQLGDG